MSKDRRAVHRRPVGFTPERTLCRTPGCSHPRGDLVYQMSKRPGRRKPCSSKRRGAAYCTQTESPVNLIRWQMLKGLHGNTTALPVGSMSGIRDSYQHGSPGGGPRRQCPIRSFTKGSYGHVFALAQVVETCVGAHRGNAPALVWCMAGNQQLVNKPINALRHQASPPRRRPPPRLHEHHADEARGPPDVRFDHW